MKKILKYFLCFVFTSYKLLIFIDLHKDWKDFSIFGTKSLYEDKMIAVKIINKSHHKLPQYATPDSAGMDLRAFIKEPVILKPLERRLIPTGLYIELPQGYEAQIRPRSGLAFKHGITVLNSPGTIDADYRGEVGVILVNLSNEDFVIEDGERICQMIIAPYSRADLFEVEELTDTNRGAGGFGHTGKK